MNTATGTTNMIIINDNTYETINTSPFITTPSKTGTKHWRGYIVKKGADYYLTSSWFNENTKTGNTSAQQFAEPYIVAQKNLGKINETSLAAQADLEFASMIKKEQDKRNSERFLPMLAQKFTDRSKYVTYPACVQPKLDGMRMLYNGKEAWSRGGKDILATVREHLVFDTQNMIIDGELILKGNEKLQLTMSAAKKFTKGLSDQLQYHVYDIISPTSTFEERNLMLKTLISKINNPNIILVETYVANNEAEIRALHADFVKRGYEGTIVRNRDGLYEVNQRSNGLQKFKDMIDSEFKILDVIQGDGSAAGCAIFVCETHDGSRVFNCKPEGTVGQQKAYYQDRKNLINRFLTIRYQTMSTEMVPIFPVGVSIRDIGEF